MHTILKRWNLHRVLKLAPDITMAIQVAANSTFWSSCGHDQFSAWGIYQDEKPYEVVLDLFKLEAERGGLSCNCNYGKPCQHALGLLMLLVTDENRFTFQEAPTFVKAKLDSGAIRARKLYERDQISEAENDGKRFSQIEAGIAELDTWLTNLMRRGLSDPQVKQYALWDAIANRLSDAQAPALANWLRDLASIPLKNKDWVEPLLDELGQIYLLIESFKRFNVQTRETQADIRTALGWHVKPSEVYAAGVHDEWVVTGVHRFEINERTRGQRIWLRGKKDALIEELAFDDAMFSTDLQPGQAFNGELVFFPSRYKLRAYLPQKNVSEQTGVAAIGDMVSDSIRHYSAAISQNPWLKAFPMVLEAVIPARFAGGWVLREADGLYLPLAADFAHRWSLMTLSGGKPIYVGGEWNGHEFLPLTAILEGRLINLNALVPAH